MGVKAIRAEYKAILDTVTGIGVVHARPRLSTDWGKFLDLYKDSTGKILGWDISRERTSRERPFMNQVHDLPHTILIRGYMGFQDSGATPDVWDDLIDAVCDKFRPLDSITADFQIRLETLLEVTLNTERMFGNVLCHYCELRQIATERKTFVS